MQDESLNEFVKSQREAVESNFEGQVAIVTNIAEQFGASEVASALRGQSTRLLSERFELMVAGRFKVGKSTFLNALLTSASRAAGIGGENGPLPVDTLPCTAVLTRVEYSESPFVRAKFFDGRTEDWSFDRYIDEARLYGETAGMDNEDVANSTLARVASFDLGLPVELLRRGLVLVDSPGISEDSRRTALARDALRNVHAGIVMLRSDVLAGTDEIDFALEVVENTGRAFPVVNMFPTSEMTDRFLSVVKNRTARLCSESDLNKLEADTFFVDCRSAFDGYRTDDAGKVRRSGIQKLERRLAEFLIHGAYATKVRGAVDGAVKLCSVLKDELSRLRIALRAEQKSFQDALSACDVDMRQIDTRRDRVATIMARTARRAGSEAAESYRHMCRELEFSLEARFAEQPIASLATKGGKLGALVTKKAAREAAEILNDIIDTRVREWAEAAPGERGLQRDLMPVLEEGRVELNEQYADIDARLQGIGVRISAFDLNAGEPASSIPLLDRWGGAGLGFLMFGPPGAILAVGGWRGAVGTTLGAIAGKAAVLLAASIFGLSLGPVAIAAVITAALTGGATGALMGIEDRIRKGALKAIKAKLKGIAEDHDTIEALKAQVSATLEAEGAEVVAALDSVLKQQRESLDALREASGTSLAEREAKLSALADADGRLVAAKRQLGEIALSVSSETPLAA